MDEHPPRSKRAGEFALLAVSFYAVHAGYHVWQGHPEDCLWACHIACLVVAAGYWFESPTLNGIGTLWLLLGNVMWVIALLGGDVFLFTSLLTHVGGLWLALRIVVRSGIPRGVWWKALLAFAALQQVTRWLTSPETNVNLAFSVWPGWERWFPGYVWYCTTLYLVGACTFIAVESLLRERTTRWPSGEDLDLVVSPSRRSVTVNPDSPNIPHARVKSTR